MNPVVHVPHASTTVPEAVRDQFLLSDDGLAREILRMTDHATDELFRPELPDTPQVVFPASRLVVDPERFLDDRLEPMAAVGMGAVYERTSDGRPLRRRLSDGERKRLRETWYEPHHAKLEAAVAAQLARKGACVVVDAHSFPSLPLPYEPDQRPDRPMICVGADPYHSPAWLTDLALAHFRKTFHDVALNRPFAGSLVPAVYYRTNPNVLSVMIEIRRDLYMDERTAGLTADFARVRDAILRFYARLDEPRPNRG